MDGGIPSLCDTQPDCYGKSPAVQVMGKPAVDHPFSNRICMFTREYAFFWPNHGTSQVTLWYNSHNYMENPPFFMGRSTILMVIWKIAGWWFQPLWKILVNWDDHSQCMKKKVPNHQPDSYFDIRFRSSAPGSGCLWGTLRSSRESPPRCPPSRPVQNHPGAPMSWNWLDVFGYFLGCFFSSIQTIVSLVVSTHLKNMKVIWDDYSQYMET